MLGGVRAGQVRLQPGEIAETFGITVEHTTVQDYQQHHQAPSWVDVRDRDRTTRCSPTSRSWSSTAPARSAVDGEVTVLARSSNGRRTGLRCRCWQSTTAGEGTVVVAADSDLFGDDCIDAFDHAQLWLNMAYWAALPTFASQVDHRDLDRSR